mmetsp:Transcript_17411/g.41732  ORF Transcript_17411/g.41732 Transcript_17411/m.41732 type:complete len:233 (+) Transcript_17411:214-912(+)
MQSRASWLPFVESYRAVRATCSMLLREVARHVLKCRPRVVRQQAVASTDRSSEGDPIAFRRCYSRITPQGRSARRRSGGESVPAEGVGAERARAERVRRSRWRLPGCRGGATCHWAPAARRIRRRRGGKRRQTHCVGGRRRRTRALRPAAAAWDADRDRPFQAEVLSGKGGCRRGLLRFPLVLEPLDVVLQRDVELEGVVALEEAHAEERVPPRPVVHADHEVPATVCHRLD